MTAIPDTIRPIAWENGSLVLLDQRLLPGEEKYLTIDTCMEVVDAIKNMVVRGAPAIGITAAYGMVLAAREEFRANPDDWKNSMIGKIDQLAAARPTAVNLVWAINRMQEKIKELEADPETELLQEASLIHQEDIAANHKMGELGARLINNADAVLTHCNAGALATGGFGTALGVIRTAYVQNRIKNVFASETRPWLQGARLTAWELNKDHIPVKLLADSAAAYLMASGELNWVIVGADRIAANGDVANKIGTYNHAITAHHHDVKFMVVAPSSTVDMSTATGADIRIEQRDCSELTSISGIQIAPRDIAAVNPVFDITPAQMIDVIVTEKGVIHSPDRDKMAALFGP